MEKDEIKNENKNDNNNVIDSGVISNGIIILKFLIR
jgi:hypothetical protein